jgi:hypothetical protein
MNNANTPWDLGELIILALDGSISKEQFTVLNERLKNDAVARQYYREFLTVSIALQSGGATAGRLPQEGPTEALDPKLWGALAEDESHAHVVATEHAQPTAAVEEESNVVLHRPSKLPFYAALIAASILILLMGYVYIVPLYTPARSFAKFIATSGAKWATAISAKVDSKVPDEPLKLLEGSATIELRKGAQVTLQGRAEVSIESNSQVYLASGTVSSSITTKDGLGFAVRTPNAIIRDYGTEFTVTVMPDGRTTVTVTKGQVELIPLVGQGDAQAGQMLTAGQSGQVDPQGDLSASASSQADPLTMFVIKDKATTKEAKKTDIDGPSKFLDLADIIGGGNGFCKSQRRRCQRRFHLPSRYPERRRIHAQPRAIHRRRFCARRRKRPMHSQYHRNGIQGKPCHKRQLQLRYLQWLAGH